MQTYIIKTKGEEFYCGCTSDFVVRLQDHLNESEPHWFAYNNRKNISHYIIINGDFEFEIKRAGVKVVYNIIMNSASASGVK